MKKILKITATITAMTIFLAMPATAEEKKDIDTQVSLPYQESNPFLAGTLSIIPGLGQIYNEQYTMGGLIFATEVGLYLAAAGYAGVFDSSRPNSLSYESLFLLAVAGRIHLFAIFDATWESNRRNNTLEKWSVLASPDGSIFGLSFQTRF